MNLLVSFAHFGTRKDFGVWPLIMELWASTGLPVMLDSGAFSMVKSGANIEHGRYIEFGRGISTKYPNIECIQLDCPRNPAGTAVNLKKERAAGFNSLPVFVANLPPTEFGELTQTYGNRVCVAGGQDSGDPRDVVERLSLLRRFSAGAQMHVLGFTRGLWPLKTEGFSFDSSSWIAGARFGSFHFYDEFGQTGYKAVHHTEIKKKRLLDLPRYVRDPFFFSGITEHDFRGPTGARTITSTLAFFSADTWLRMAKRYEAAGKRFYFAAVAPGHLVALILAMKHQRNVGFDWPAAQRDLVELRDALNPAAFNPEIILKHLHAAKAKWDSKTVAPKEIENG